MVRYRASVRSNLAEQQRFDEAPQGDGIVAVGHGPSDFEGSQHVTFDIEMARHVRIADPSFIHASESAQGMAIAQGDVEAWRPVAKASAMAVRKNHLERRWRFGEPRHNSVGQSRPAFSARQRKHWSVRIWESG